MLAWLACWPAFAADDITVVGLFRDKAIVEIDGRRHTLTTGESTEDGIRLISADSQRAVLEIDGVRKSFELGDHIIGEFEPSRSRNIVTVAPDRQGMYYVNGSINNFQVRFVVDTGASLIVLNRPQAQRIGIDYRLEGKKSNANTASGIIPVYVVNLDKVKVGDIELHDVKAAVHDGDFPETILLGNSFLRKLSIRRDGQLLELHQK